MPIQIASLFAKIGADTSGLNQGLSDASKAIGRTKENTMSLATSMGALTASFAAVGAAGKLIWDTGKEGAAIERAQTGFEMLSGSASVAAENLEMLRTVTRNTRSDFELMQGASNLMALGLAEDATQLGQIMKNVEALGSRFGGTMQVFQLMMSNQSLMRIDSFGIGVEEATKRIDEFKEAGMSAEQAFNTAILELMEEKYVSLGGAVQDSALAYEQLEANFKNISDAMKMQVSTAIGPLVGGYAEFMNATIQADESLIGFAATFRMLETVIGRSTGAYTEWGQAVEKANGAADGEPIASLTGKMYALASQAMAATSNVNALSGALDSLPAEKHIGIYVESFIKKYNWTGPEFEMTPSGTSSIPIPEPSGDNGMQSTTFNGGINVSGVSDPNAAANAVIQKLADRGIIHSGGYR